MPAKGGKTMTVDGSGAYKRINESHYPNRVREAGLTRERADDQRHLAEFEEEVRKQKHKHHENDTEENQEQPKQDNSPQDVVELHTDEKPEPPVSPEPPQADEEKNPPDDGRPHLDIRI